MTTDKHHDWTRLLDPRTDHIALPGLLPFPADVHPEPPLCRFPCITVPVIEGTFGTTFVDYTGELTKAWKEGEARKNEVAAEIVRKALEDEER